MKPNSQSGLVSRRDLLVRSGYGLGAIGLHVLGAAEGRAATAFPNFAPKAKRVIFLFQSGGPSHLDLFDHKPILQDRFGEDIPESVFQGQRVTGMVAHQARFQAMPSKYAFQRHGQSGISLSELLPHTAGIADDICLIRSVHTEAINHDPAITFFQTGSQLPGRPSMGAWVDYGLGSSNRDLPAFVVLHSVASEGPGGQGLLARLWGAGFLPSRHQGVQFRSNGDPVLYLNDPPGMTRHQRRLMLDGAARLNKLQYRRVGDPEIETRIEQYEMAYRMQASVPELMDVSAETEGTYKLYGPDSRKPGTFAANCLLARRLAERDVRFVQLYHRGWDHHGELPKRLPVSARDTDQPSAALVQDLKQRGLMDDTLVVWAGEFGRTPYAQGDPKPDDYGRDHHGKCFSIWMAGAGVKPGHVHGSTDEYGFNVAEGAVSIYDVQATILHLLGIDHEQLVYRFQGRRFRLTDTEGRAVNEVLS
ncbi:MAG: DUF1501 domain-containing protein [Bryobacterales bacterium]|nr:DUF1501 domain-containing protein [Bryobacterales bacterium]